MYVYFSPVHILIVYPRSCFAVHITQGQTTPHVRGCKKPGRSSSSWTTVRLFVRNILRKWYRDCRVCGLLKSRNNEWSFGWLEITCYYYQNFYVIWLCIRLICPNRFERSGGGTKSAGDQSRFGRPNDFSVLSSEWIYGSISTCHVYQQMYRKLFVAELRTKKPYCFLRICMS